MKISHKSMLCYKFTKGKQEENNQQKLRHLSSRSKRCELGMFGNVLMFTCQQLRARANIVGDVRLYGCSWNVLALSCDIYRREFAAFEGTDCRTGTRHIR